MPHDSLHGARSRSTRPGPAWALTVLVWTPYKTSSPLSDSQTHLAHLWAPPEGVGTVLGAEEDRGPGGGWGGGTQRRHRSRRTPSDALTNDTLGGTCPPTPQLPRPPGKETEPGASAWTHASRGRRTGRRADGWPCAVPRLASRPQCAFTSRAVGFDAAAADDENGPRRPSGLGPEGTWRVCREGETGAMPAWEAVSAAPAPHGEGRSPPPGVSTQGTAEPSGGRQLPPAPTVSSNAQAHRGAVPLKGTARQRGCATRFTQETSGLRGRAGQDGCSVLPWWSPPQAARAHACACTCACVCVRMCPPFHPPQRCSCHMASEDLQLQGRRLSLLAHTQREGSPARGVARAGDGRCHRGGGRLRHPSAHAHVTKSPHGGAKCACKNFYVGHLFQATRMDRIARRRLTAQMKNILEADDSEGRPLSRKPSLHPHEDPAPLETPV